MKRLFFKNICRIKKRKYQVRKILREKEFTEEKLKRYSKDGCINPSNYNEYNITNVINKHGRTI